MEISAVSDRGSALRGRDAMTDEREVGDCGGGSRHNGRRCWHIERDL